MTRMARVLPRVEGDHGPYLLGDRLGAGGMGVVYEAVCPTSVRRVAVKFLHPDRVQDDRARRRFLDETLANRLIAHPNVARVVDAGCTADGAPFLVLELVAGEPLGLRVGREGQLPPRRAVAIARQILAALAAVHRAGVVHADIKSDNVLVDADDDVKLIDFGLARVQFLRGRAELPTSEEWLSGTPEYMAPEVIRGDGASFASDLYAVGIILYELLTGSTPFTGGSSAEIVARHLEDEVVPPSLRAGSELTPELDAVILRALDKDPALRFESAEAFASALAHATRSLPATAAPVIGRPRDGGRRRSEATTVDGPRRRLARGTPGLRRRRPAGRGRAA